MVTGSNDRAAQNFGRERQPEHDLRYEMADEFVEVVRQLWDSWDEGAVVMDRASGVYVDHTKVHPIDYKGLHFSSRGPLNTVKAPQGHPVLVQAGVSPRGRHPAHRHGSPERGEHRRPRADRGLRYLEHRDHQRRGPGR
jgi:alkanesulfonate monooxygenase SsuD/methylene tetrahydromethanopterin reductase-like flavin-dependent oxidoreductase (luciferase family)